MVDRAAAGGIRELRDVVADGQTVRVHGPGSLTFILSREGDQITTTHERLGGSYRHTVNGTMFVRSVEQL